MTDLDHGAVCAELDAILASVGCGAAAVNHTLPGKSNAVGRSVQGADVRPDIVADASVRNAHFHQGNKASGSTPAITGQYAETTPSHTPVPQHTNHHPGAHQQHDTTTPSSSYQQEKREGAAWRIVARRYGTSASSSHQPDRKPRRAAAQLDKVALKKTWDGSKRQQRRDKLSAAEKFSASVWSAAATKGLAVSLNLGISREAMLRNHTKRLADAELRQGCIQPPCFWSASGLLVVRPRQDWLQPCAS